MEVPYLKPIAGPRITFDRDMVLDLVKMHGLKGAINRIAGRELQKTYVAEVVLFILNHKE